MFCSDVKTLYIAYYNAGVVAVNSSRRIGSRSKKEQKQGRQFTDSIVFVERSSTI
jgi:hypothetical protein